MYWFLFCCCFFFFVFFFLVVVVSSEDEDPGAEGGDEYEEDQESDSDIDEEDLWACPQCNLKNHPMSRQCARCWVERHEWLPHLKRCVNIVQFLYQTLSFKAVKASDISQVGFSLWVCGLLEVLLILTTALVFLTLESGFEILNYKF